MNGSCVVFDPLDGSSNIDAGVNVGTIFGVYKLVSTITLGSSVILTVYRYRERDQRALWKMCFVQERRWLLPGTRCEPISLSYSRAALLVVLN